MKPIAIIAIIAAVVVVGGACAGVAFSGVLNGGTTGPGGDDPVVPTDPVDPTPTETPTETPTTTPTPTETQMSTFAPMTSSGSSSGSSTPSHTHTYSEEFSYDDTYHWHAATCGHDDEKTGSDVHSYGESVDCIMPAPCTVCDYVRPAKPQHTFGTPQYGDGKHYYTCSVCNKQQIIALCTYTPDEYESNADQHWQTCSVCNLDGSKTDHDFEWVVDTPATTTTTGTKHEECSVCEYKRSEDTVIAKLSHTHTMTKTDAVDATCTVNGMKAYWTCTAADGTCTGKKYGDENGNIEVSDEDLVILAGHTFSDWTKEVPATCTTEGKLGYKSCSVCNKNYDADGNELSTLEISALDHAWIWESVDDTNHKKICTRCSLEETGKHSYTPEKTQYDLDGENPLKIQPCDNCDYVKKTSVVAKIDDVGYETIAAAIEAANADDIITLLVDVEIEEGVANNIAINKEITIDGNGKTITRSFDLVPNKDDPTYGNYEAVFQVTAAGVTIQNVNFEQATVAMKDEAFIYVDEGGNTLTVSGNTFTGMDDSGLAGVIVKAKISNLVISGNTFTNLKYAAYFNDVDKADVSGNTVDGTQYNAFNLAAGTATFTDNTLTNIATADKGNSYDLAYNSGIALQGNAVATITGGSIAMAYPDNDVEIDAAKIGDVYYANPNDAINAAKTDDTIELMAGTVTLNDIALNERTLTIKGHEKGTTVTPANSPVDKGCIVVPATSGGTLTVEGIIFTNLDNPNNQGHRGLCFTEVLPNTFVVNVKDCTFTGFNTGIYLGHVMDATITGCTFTGCSAGIGGSESITGTLSVTGCEFKENAETIGWAGTGKLVIKNSPSCASFNDWKNAQGGNPTVVQVTNGNYDSSATATA